MTLSAKDIEKLKSHWAVGAIGPQKLDRADKLVYQRLAQRGAGEQIDFSFTQNEDDDSFLGRVALAYEMAAIEGLDELSRPAGENVDLRQQAMAAAFHAFGIRRHLPVPEALLDRLFFVLQLSALAYCGDRWSDLRRWYKDNAEAITAPDDAAPPWDRRLLYRLFDCWIRLFRKDGWNDLDQISKIITRLREDQKIHEEARLRNDSQAEDRAIALRLAALYHWARGTEILAHYMLQGEPPQGETANPFGHIDKHFEAGIKAATASGDAQHEMILRWLHAAGRIMVTNSLWWATRTVNSRMTEFVQSLTQRNHQAMFELLPPQRAALLEQGLLDPAKTAIVVDMPTSGGKTLLAQFRILQALNQFDADKGWVAYVAPTRALSAQITRRLRKDFEPIGICVEQLTAAIEIDSFEEQLLNDQDQSFHVLVATPEKLSLVIRNKKVHRPLSLVIMDEAQNMETEGRGMRIEFLLATIKRDCPQANFLLLMPYVEDAQTVAHWLAQDINAGQVISLGTTPWKPNERIIGLYRAVADDSKGDWRLVFETLTTTEKAMRLHGNHRVGGVRPIPSVSRSAVIDAGKQQKGLSIQTAAIASVMSNRRSTDATSVAVTTRTGRAWSMARKAAEALPEFENIPDDINLVQDFLRTEIGPDFELINMLNRGVGVHHAGLSDDVRSLIEWLAETGSLRVLCATTTIAQGINFPVSSVFLAGTTFHDGKKSVEMAPRDFWNLAGRAGRINHDSVGVIGLAEGKNKRDRIEFINKNTGALVSRLVSLLDELAAQGNLANLSENLWQDQWDDFRCYINHLWAEKKDLDAVLANTDQLLRQTYGYTTLRNDPTQNNKADTLLKAAQSYAHELADMPPGVPALADSTGFSPEGVKKAIAGLSGLGERLTPSDWTPESLFGTGGKMANLFGVMLNVPQLNRQLNEIRGKGFDNSRISKLTCDWVNGKRLDEIAKEYFSEERDEGDTSALTNACRAIYRVIVHNGTWGISALSRVSGLDFDTLSEVDRRRVNALPAMIYHGVRTEDAVLMRMNAAPRSVAESLGHLYQKSCGEEDNRYSISNARKFLKELDVGDWDHARPADAPLSGSDYKRVWEVLSGEGDS